jgi:hypothetical protein
MAAKARFIVRGPVFFIVYHFALPIFVGYAPKFMNRLSELQRFSLVWKGMDNRLTRTLRHGISEEFFHAVADRIIIGFGISFSEPRPSAFDWALVTGIESLFRFCQHFLAKGFLHGSKVSAPYQTGRRADRRNTNQVAAQDAS